MAKSALFTLFTLLWVSHLSSALQVTPNSPCSSVCRDSLDLDASDPNSSNTRNSDITCRDSAYSSAAGTKFKNCMTCLEKSTFSQGSESDTMWFLYNLRYTTAYCVFGFPNATGIASTPCTTSKACGNLQASMQHGLLNPASTTAYSYCKAGAGEAMEFSNFESCIPCISAEGTTEYIANFFVALEAGCRQQPAPGMLLGLNDTVFASTQISIVDPTAPKSDEGAKTGLGVPVIVGIVAGALVLLLVVAGATFICLRKRKNKRARASAEADFYSRFHPRHRSSMSFQCQTHMVSPRFWPSAGAEEGLSTPTADSPDAAPIPHHRSSIYKPHDPDYPYPSTTTAKPTTTTTTITTLAPLHITTTVPPQAYASPTSAERVYHSPSDFRSPLSAESTRSTAALLPSIRPYVPAEHGVHVPGSPPIPTIVSPVATTTTSPLSATGTGTGTGMTPLLKAQGWPLPVSVPVPVSESPYGQSHQRSEKSERHVIKLGGAVPPPPPPPLKTSWRGSSSSGGGSGLMMGRKSPKLPGGGGSPVESWEIQTAFAAPPRR